MRPKSKHETHLCLYIHLEIILYTVLSVSVFWVQLWSFHFWLCANTQNVSDFGAIGMFRIGFSPVTYGIFQSPGQSLCSGCCQVLLSAVSSCVTVSSAEATSQRS